MNEIRFIVIWAVYVSSCRRDFVEHDINELELSICIILVSQNRVFQICLNRIADPLLLLVP